MRFKTKPMEIEASQFVGPPHPHVHLSRVTGGYFTSGKQGAVLVNLGDWIIREHDGSGHYPCAPDIFWQKYEFVRD